MSTDIYDRQIRLWGEGQILICNSRIICFNSDGAASEILKNLVLAGVGYFVIVDDKIIDENDIKENFFLNKSDIGENRAQICLQNLLQLNPDSKGAFYQLSPEEFIQSSLLQLQTFDLVISSNKQDKFNDLVFHYAEKFCQRVIIIRNFGLINYLRIFEKFHANIQLKLLDNPVNDFRIPDPWSDLKEFCSQYDFDSMDIMMHKHIPWIIILRKALEIFKDQNKNRNPSTSLEKTELKKIINSMRKYKDETNFDEALNFYYYANEDKINQLTPDIKFIFETIEKNSLIELVKNSNVIMSTFFIVCNALRIYFQYYGTMPVVGNIPDMTSDTETYINLKQIYEEKGKKDRVAVSKLVYEFMNTLNDKDLSLKKEQILSALNNPEVKYIEAICKNWPQISLFNYSGIKEEKSGVNYNLNDLDEEFQKRNFIWYLLIKSANLFYEKYNRYPGQNLNHETFFSDVSLFKECFQDFTSLDNKVIPFEMPEDFEDYVFEFCRFSNSKIVPANSIIASIASQEAIKLITYQFKTIDNTLIFDGVNSTISIFKC